MRGSPALALLVAAILASACTGQQSPDGSGAATPSPPAVKPSPTPSPTPLVVITDNKALLEPPGADFCHQGGQVHFQWTVSGARQGDILLVNFSGFANQNADNIPIPLDTVLRASKVFPFLGSGVWKSHVVSVAGVLPTGSLDNMASVTCN